MLHAGPAQHEATVGQGCASVSKILYMLLNHLNIVCVIYFSQMLHVCGSSPLSELQVSNLDHKGSRHE
jgi:hypothetical protein